MVMDYNPSEIEVKWPRKNFSTAPHRPIRHCASGNQRGKQEEYNPNKIEAKWQAFWSKNKTFQVDIKNAPKPYFNLMMFPYPSAEGLHVGNMYAFTGSDIWGRFMQMKGFAVFEPIGLDGFGIHSENYAIKVGKHPAEQAKISQANFYRQLKSIGNMFSWDNKLETYDPDYYKWTQWIFIKLFKAGLAYRTKAKVNWCPSCKTVLADEQVIDGLCERCSNKVEDRDLEQWFFRITEYADRLLENTKKIDWTEKVLIAQRNWIGKSEGINITYPIVTKLSETPPPRCQDDSSDGGVSGVSKLTVTCFTTRPDTNFGATFVVMSPEHPIVASLLNSKFSFQGRPVLGWQIPNSKKEEIKNYVKKAQKISKEERIAQGREKTGVFTGLYCLNQLNGCKMPLWISDFVIMDVGTGVVVGVPASDVRDFEFANKYNIPIIRVIVGKDGYRGEITKKEQVCEEGTLINSEFLNGLERHVAGQKMMDYIEKKGWGKRTVHYHLRDWLISRQRYWGPPIPMVYCKSCAEKGISWFNKNSKHEIRSTKQILNSKFQILNSQMPGWFPIPEDQLPIELPYVKDWRPKGTGRGPLMQLKDWVKITCPNCGGEAQRETDVSDTFLDSAWYFLRYPSHIKESPLYEERQWDPQITKEWLPVDIYIGGAEHSVLHLLYARFLTMVFKDLKLLDFEEPFTKFRAHGLIIKDSAKMSKSKGNIVNPDKYITKYGADSLRCYLMFLGPFSDGGDFRDTGMVGMYKFLNRVYRLMTKFLRGKDTSDGGARLKAETTPPRWRNKEELYWQHKTIKRVTEGIERLKYNTSLAAIMEFVNFLQDPTYESGRSTRVIQSCSAPDSSAGKQKEISQEALKTLILLLAPFAPHLTEELWQSFIPASPCLAGRQAVGRHHPSTHYSSIHHQPWPTYDPKFIKEETIIIVVQVNGKVRDRVEVDSVLANFSSPQDKEKILALIKKSLKLQPYLKNQPIKKTIFVKGKLVNLVVG